MPKFVTPSAAVNYYFTRPHGRGRGSPAGDFDPAIHRYLIVADDICPRTGVSFWQCYVQYLTEVRWTAVKRYFGDDIHGGPCLHTPEECIDYTKSFERVVEHGRALMSDPAVTLTVGGSPSSHGEDE